MPFPISREEIAKSELELGTKFPATYIARMELSNGAEIETEDDLWLIHPIRNTADRKTISRTANHVVLETKSLREWPNVPAGAVSIGEGNGGNRLLLLPSATEVNQLGEVIYFWDHETGALEQIVSNFADLGSDVE